ncbi:MAG: hypothetical protein IIZ93_08910 [Acidaminococcaceae bacterium]|nr:hypothetical protein [Acidaminococcaceae bacterium]
MALMQNYNRIIRLKIYKAQKQSKVLNAAAGIAGNLAQPLAMATGGEYTFIDCPTRGRKPSIEITGNFTSQSYLPAFNITIKNLYLNLKDESYSTVEVEAGYEGRTTTFTGKIYSMYQEQPGPEGKTVIQCKEGSVQPWLDATIQMTLEPGTPLVTALNQIGQKLGVYMVHAGDEAKALQIKQRFYHDGSVRSAIEKLKKLFEADKLDIFLRGNFLVAICLKDGQDFVNSYVLDFMSAPPQENTGGSDGTYYTTVTAPWMPELRIGDRLTIPSRTYIRNLVKVGSDSGLQDIQVTALSFHFGTTGAVNTMTVQGFLVGRKK